MNIKKLIMVNTVDKIIDKSVELYTLTICFLTFLFFFFRSMETKMLFVRKTINSIFGGTLYEHILVLCLFALNLSPFNSFEQIIFWERFCRCSQKRRGGIFGKMNFVFHSWISFFFSPFFWNKEKGLLHITVRILTLESKVPNKRIESHFSCVRWDKSVLLYFLGLMLCNFKVENQNKLV